MKRQIAHWWTVDYFGGDRVTNCHGRTRQNRSATGQSGDNPLTDEDRSAADAPVQAGPPRRRPNGSNPSRQNPHNGAGAPRGMNGKRTNTQNPSQRRWRGPVYAALDLGTNNCRLLVARPQDGSFRVIDGFTRIVRLGEGVSQTGRLGDDAMARTLEALKQCNNKLNHHEPRRMRLIATEACRAATNGEEFLNSVRSEIGMELEIIDRRTEAELAVTGCADLVDSEAKGALMFDIGGGSSELAWLDFRGGRPKNQSKMSAAIRSWQSLPVGVVSVAEKFGGVNVTPEIFEAMVADVTAHLRKFKGREKLRQMIREHPVHLIGTSGTVTTLAGLHLGLERYERSKVDGLWMRNEELVDTMRVVLGMSYERRMSHSCIGRDRADLVLPGCAIFEAIRREWPTERLRVADRGLREGILISLMEADRAWSRRPKRSSKAN